MLSAASIPFVSCYLPPDGPCHFQPLIFMAWVVETSRVGLVERSYLGEFLVVVGVSRQHDVIPKLKNPPAKLTGWLL
jgi:hypothetical protein